jgi:3-hydroxybutyryl-CoA dehydrogenase
VNLAGRAYVTEALQIVQEGVADVATVDRIMRDGAGFRMGPFELMDLTGIDVNFPATTYIFQGYQHDPRLRTTTLHELMFNAGRFGRKTGRGYHDYGAAEDAVLEAAPPPPGLLAARIVADDGGPGWSALRGLGLGENGELALIAPLGEDASSACHRLGLDPRATVAVDFTGLERRHLTLMTAPGGGAAAARVAEWLRGHGYRVETIKDSPGFVLQRILAMIANLGCELAQIGVGTPEDIDLAMRLAQNYPRGPLEWAEHLGVARVHEMLRGIQSVTGSDRYRPSLWLRRRALLGLPVHTAD